MLNCINMLLDHNYAIRQQLLDSLRSLNSKEFVKELGVGWGSLRDIMVHLVNTERYWIWLLKSKEMDWFLSADFPDVDGVSKIWQITEKDAKDFVGTQTESSLQHVKSVVWGDRTVSFTVAKALVHMATHETHHRGLVIGLIRQLGYEPPDVDML
ncbi:MAG: DinB family protein [Candidatus Thorarchaeota archaeon]